MSQDLSAVNSTTDLEEAHPQLREMIRALAVQASFAEERGGSQDFVLSIMEGILSADSIEDIFAAQESGMIAGRDFTNRPFEVSNEGVTWLRSGLAATNPNSFPFYAVLNVKTLDTGEEVTLGCGGQTFVATLWALQQKGYLEVPRALSLAATPTTDGKAYLSLRPFKRPEAPASASRGKK